MIHPVFLVFSPYSCFPHPSNHILHICSHNCIFLSILKVTAYFKHILSLARTISIGFFTGVLFANKFPFGFMLCRALGIFSPNHKSHRVSSQIRSLPCTRFVCRINFMPVPCSVCPVSASDLSEQPHYPSISRRHLGVALEASTPSLPISSLSPIPNEFLS